MEIKNKLKTLAHSTKTVLKDNQLAVGVFLGAVVTTATYFILDTLQEKERSELWDHHEKISLDCYGPSAITLRDRDGDFHSFYTRKNPQD